MRLLVLRIIDIDMMNLLDSIFFSCGLNLMSSLPFVANVILCRIQVSSRVFLFWSQLLLLFSLLCLCFFVPVTAFCLVRITHHFSSYSIEDLIFLVHAREKKGGGGGGSCALYSSSLFPILSPPSMSTLTIYVNWYISCFKCCFTPCSSFFCCSCFEI